MVLITIKLDCICAMVFRDYQTYFTVANADVTCPTHSQNECVLKYGKPQTSYNGVSYYA